MLSYQNITEKFPLIKNPKTSCVDLTSDIKFFALPTEMGFHFVSLERVVGADEWEQEHKVEVLLQGTALFDGTRHLYMGSSSTNNKGYLYYPHIPALRKILGLVEGLEETICNTEEIHREDLNLNQE